MNTRELATMIVDADIEAGAEAPVLAQTPDGKMYSIKALQIEEGASFEGNRESGPTVWLQIEEM